MENSVTVFGKKFSSQIRMKNWNEIFHRIKFQKSVSKCFILTFLIKTKHFDILELKCLILSQLNVNLCPPDLLWYNVLQPAVVRVPCGPVLLHTLGSPARLHFPWVTLLMPFPQCIVSIQQEARSWWIMEGLVQPGSSAHRKKDEGTWHPN